MNIRVLWLPVIACGLLQACVTASEPVGPRPASAEEAAQANLNLGAAYLRQGRADLALDILERALSQNPRLADAHSTIAIAYDQLGDPQQAEQHYRRATQLEPRNSAAANSYAVFLCRHDRWRDAEPYFNRAVDNPRYNTPAVALTNAGVCARNAGELDKAEQYFRAALERNESFADALYNLMEMSYEADNYLQARAFLQRYTDSRRPGPDVLWLCHRIELALDNPVEAERCARVLREDFPESAEFAELRRSQNNAGQ